MSRTALYLYTVAVRSHAVQRALTTLVLLCFAIGSGLNVDWLIRCAPTEIVRQLTDANDLTVGPPPSLSAAPLRI
jgi:hypothetical protein